MKGLDDEAEFVSRAAQAALLKIDMVLPEEEQQRVKRTIQSKI